jgi:hypothetical protein
MADEACAVLVDDRITRLKDSIFDAEAGRGEAYFAHDCAKLKPLKESSSPFNSIPITCQVIEARKGRV